MCRYINGKYILYFPMQMMKMTKLYKIRLEKLVTVASDDAIGNACTVAIGLSLPFMLTGLLLSYFMMSVAIAVSGVGLISLVWRWFALWRGAKHIPMAIFSRFFINVLLAPYLLCICGLIALVSEHYTAASNPDMIAISSSELFTAALILLAFGIVSFFYSKS